MDQILELINSPAGSGTVDYKETVLFAVTPRCGSTALVEGLASMGCASEIREILNPRGPFQRMYSRVGGQNLRQYLNNVFRADMLQEKLIFKSAFPDYDRVREMVDIDEYFPELKIVYLERKNKVAQAVSLYRAILSNKWHLSGADTLETPSADFMESALNVDRVIDLIEVIRSQCRAWERCFTASGAAPLRIFYEDFETQPHEMVRVVAWWIGLPFRNRTPVITHRKLADDISVEWLARVRRELAGRPNLRIKADENGD